MNKRGWLASGLLAAAVIGGYLGLLPLLSSLAAGPAWPEPIAHPRRERRRHGDVAVAGRADGRYRGAGRDRRIAEVVRNDDRRPTAERERPARGRRPSRPSRTRRRRGHGRRVRWPRARDAEARDRRPAQNGGSGGGSVLGGSAGGGGGSGAGGGSNGGGSAAPATPASPGPLDDIGAGTLAGDGRRAPATTKPPPAADRPSGRARGIRVDPGPCQKGAEADAARDDLAPGASTVTYDYDLVVLGSGPAGQKAAIQAAKLGTARRDRSSAGTWSAACAPTRARSRPRRCARPSCT